MADDYWDEIIAGAVDIWGSQMQANAARRAANTASDSYLQGISAMQGATAQARLEILNRMNPALKDFNNQIAGMQNEITTGNADIMNIMAKTTGGIDTLLAGTGANVQRALLGSAAVSRGIPQQQFDQSFNRVLQMPPQQQQQAMQKFESAVNTYTPIGGGGLAAPMTDRINPYAAGNQSHTGVFDAGSTGRTGDGGGQSDSDVGNITGSMNIPSSALGALGSFAGATVGSLMGPWGALAGKFIGSQAGNAIGDGQGGGPGALAAGTAGSDAASLAAAEAAANIPGYADVNTGPVGGGDTSTGGPSQGSPGETAALTQRFLSARQAQEQAKALGWKPQFDSEGNMTQSAEQWLASQGVTPQAAASQQTPHEARAAGPLAITNADLTPYGTGGINPSANRGIGAAAGLGGYASQGQGYDVSADIPRIQSSITGDAMPTVQGQSQYVPPTGISTGYGGAFSELDTGEATALQRLAMGMGTARGDIYQGTQGALGAIGAGEATARGDISQGVTGALNQYSPYSEAGRGALTMEAAITGALGPEAQAKAYASYSESPGQKYLREQQEKALLRSSAAIGGLGGGRIRSALMEQAMGIASTNQQQYIDNLRNLAGRGQSAAGSMADVITGGAQQTAGISSTAAQQRASTIAGGAQQLAAIAESMGITGANLATMTAQQKAALAERAGISLAQLEQTIGQAQISNLENYGQGLAQLRANEIGQITNLGQLGALTNLQGQQNISEILANMATLQGTNTASLLGAAGQSQAAGQMAQGNIWGNTASRLGNLALAAQ